MMKILFQFVALVWTTVATAVVNGGPILQQQQQQPPSSLSSISMHEVSLSLGEDAFSRLMYHTIDEILDVRQQFEDDDDDDDDKIQNIFPTGSIPVSSYVNTAVPTAGFHEHRGNTRLTVHDKRDTDQHLVDNNNNNTYHQSNNELLILDPESLNIDSSLDSLRSFLTEHRGYVDQLLLQHGAIKIRGFEIRTARHVEDAIRAYNPDLNNQYRGTSPRLVQDGSNYVFSAAEVPSHYPISQHLEMSFLPAPPKQLYFSALRAPVTTSNGGGETSIADFRKVYQDLPEPLRTKLDQKKLRYRRTHHQVAEQNTHDVAAMLSWPQLFGTNDPGEVERIVATEQSTNPTSTMKWTGQNNSTFVQEWMSDPFQRHPTTNERVWFNHIQVFHWTSFPAELFAAFQRTGDIRLLCHALWVGVKSLWKYGILGQEMALHVEYGDGSQISVWEAYQIRRTIHTNMVFDRWQRGDLLLIDNFSTSHGRQPTYDSGRKVVVSWSDTLEKDTP